MVNESLLYVFQVRSFADLAPPSFEHETLVSTILNLVCINKRNTKRPKLGLNLRVYSGLNSGIESFNDTSTIPLDQELPIFFMYYLEIIQVVLV